MCQSICEEIDYIIDCKTELIPKKVSMNKKERMKYYQNHIDEVLSDDNFNHYIIQQIDTIFELFNIPIDEIDEGFEHWGNGDWKDVNIMMIESISKMVKILIKITYN